MEDKGGGREEGWGQREGAEENTERNATGLGSRCEALAELPPASAQNVRWSSVPSTAAPGSSIHRQRWTGDVEDHAVSMISVLFGKQLLYMLVLLLEAVGFRERSMGAF